MAERQTRNVSLPQHQDAFVDQLVASGRYRTASEVVREGLRLLEESELQQQLERWLLDHKADAPLDVPPVARERVRGWLRKLVSRAIQDLDAGRVEDGPVVMQRLRERLLGKAE
ncbi:MAG: type II toxin-antitoxin system ParD family antitoxin [Planctomycetes bacterium]|jgi:antitoxin ParD1/3/4|nr:type II toxin-antitoxin system ParD family antitoxin [Planctomycetota bacterium]